MPSPTPQANDRVIARLTEAIGKTAQIAAAIAATNARQTAIEVLLSALMQRAGVPDPLMVRWLRAPRDFAHAHELQRLALDIADAIVGKENGAA
jgi:hypothetical protein